MQIDVKTIGLKEAEMNLEQMAKHLPDVVKDSSFLRAVGQILLSTAKQNLEDGAAHGKSYELLAEITRKDKKRKGYSMKPLQRTGLMKQSLNIEVNTNQLKLKGIDILKHHQYGAPKANLPQREVYTVDDDAMQDIQDVLIRRLKQKMI